LDGFRVGCEDGLFVGFKDGLEEGLFVGFLVVGVIVVGILVGRRVVGINDGLVVNGRALGYFVGIKVDFTEG